MRRVNVIGVGMTKFTSPKALRPYTEMGKEALMDASRMPELITRKFSMLMWDGFTPTAAPARKFCMKLV